MFSTLRSAVIAFAAIFSAHAMADIEFHNPVAPQTIPGIKVASVYVNIENTFDKAVTLVAYKSSVAKNVELHESTVKNSRMVMRNIPEMTIKSGQSLILKPGSYHLMLIGLNKRLAPGDTVDITVTDSEGNDYRFDTTVTDTKDKQDHSHHAHH